MELTGKYLHETHDAETTEEASTCYRWMAETGRPHYWERPAGVINNYRGHITYKRVMMPLTGTDGNVAHYLGCFEFSYKES